jgi:hypothetical protein
LPASAISLIIEIPADSYLILCGLTRHLKPEILAFKVNDMPETKMPVKKANDERNEKDPKRMNNEAEDSKQGTARKESEFMDKEKEGMKSQDKSGQQHGHQGQGTSSHGKSEDSDDEKEGMKSQDKSGQQHGHQGQGTSSHGKSEDSDDEKRESEGKSTEKEGKRKDRS